jgi:hypothetical protein
MIDFSGREFNAVWRMRETSIRTNLEVALGEQPQAHRLPQISTVGRSTPELVAH